MKLSTRARYGARALAELALAYPGGPVSVGQLAEGQRISAKYLEHILSTLRAAGLVKAVRGMHGGYALARSPAAITVKELFEVLEGPVALVDCVDHPNSCPMKDVCPTRDTWVEMKQSLERVLERTTIQDLADRKTRKGCSRTAMYHI